MRSDLARNAIRREVAVVLTVISVVVERRGAWAEVTSLSELHKMRLSNKCGSFLGTATSEWRQCFGRISTPQGADPTVPTRHPYRRLASSEIPWLLPTPGVAQMER